MTWPDFTPDRQALELATAVLGPTASVQQLVQRAQEIKDDIKAGRIVLLREDFQSFLNCLLVNCHEEETEMEMERRTR